MWNNVIFHHMTTFLEDESLILLKGVSKKFYRWVQSMYPNLGTLNLSKLVSFADEELLHKIKQQYQLSSPITLCYVILTGNLPLVGYLINDGCHQDSNVLICAGLTNHLEIRNIFKNDQDEEFTNWFHFKIGLLLGQHETVKKSILLEYCHGPMREYRGQVSKWYNLALQKRVIKFNRSIANWLLNFVMGDIESALDAHTKTIILNSSLNGLESQIVFWPALPFNHYTADQINHKFFNSFDVDFPDFIIDKDFIEPCCFPGKYGYFYVDCNLNFNLCQTTEPLEPEYDYPRDNQSDETRESHKNSREYVEFKNLGFAQPLIDINTNTRLMLYNPHKRTVFACRYLKIWRK